MIGRPQPGALAGTARQRLAQVITFYLDDAKADDHRVSRTCSVSEKVVARWRTGDEVPGPEQWSKLKRSVHHTFARHSDLYQLARREAEEAAREAHRQRVLQQERERDGKPMTPATKINTALGDQLQAVKVPAAPPQTPPALLVVPADKVAAESHVANRDPKAHAEKTSIALRNLPAGWRSREAQERRRAFALEFFRQRPDANVHGADSCDAALIATFGVSCDFRSLNAAKQQARREREERERKTPSAFAKLAETEFAAAKAAADKQDEILARGIYDKPATSETIGLGGFTPSTRKPEDEIAAAAKLILEAVPNLETFTISVDDKGEASIGYTIRKVVVTSEAGSLKVQR